MSKTFPRDNGTKKWNARQIRNAVRAIESARAEGRTELVARLEKELAEVRQNNKEWKELVKAHRAAGL